jgi:MATE family multidrug resistance protein
MMDGPDVPTPFPALTRPAWRATVGDVRAQAALALPIMGAQFSQVGMTVVDTVMAGNYAADHLAAVSVGASLWMPVYLLMAGILMAITPHVARAHGAGRTRQLAGYLQNMLWLGLVLGVLAGLMLLPTRPLFALMGVADGVAELGALYLAGVAAGFPALAIYHVLRGYSEGLHQVRPVLLSGVLGLLFNIPANYVLIFGAFGAPELGALGCGIATALSMWVMMFAMAACVLRSPRLARIGLLRRRHPLHWPYLIDTLRIGVPIGLSIFFEVTLFAAIALLVASLGTQTVAAHQIALNYASLLFMAPLSLGLALTVRVGHARGRGDLALARRRSISGMLLAVAVGLVLAVFMVASAPWVVGLYTPDPQIRALAASLMGLAALFQLSDTLQVNAAGALRGYEDTRAIMLITLPAYWLVGLGTGLWLAFTELPPGPLGVHGFWVGLLAGLSVAAVLLLHRLRQRSRQAERPPAHCASAATSSE